MGKGYGAPDSGGAVPSELSVHTEMSERAEARALQLANCTVHYTINKSQWSGLLSGCMMLVAMRTCAALP